MQKCRSHRLHVCVILAAVGTSGLVGRMHWERLNVIIKDWLHSLLSKCVQVCMAVHRHTSASAVLECMHACPSYHGPFVAFQQVRRMWGRATPTRLVIGLCQWKLVQHGSQGLCNMQLNSNQQ